jgi:hypothetical protein
VLPDDRDDPSILSGTNSVRALCQQAKLAISNSANALRRNARLNQPLPYGIGAALRKAQVLLAGAAVIGMPLNDDR